MKHTTFHSNSLAVLAVGTIAAMVMAVTGHECLGQHHLCRVNRT